MDDCEKRVLHQFRHRLANELLVTENFLSAFCEKNVLDEEMSGIIKNELSFVARAHRLLDVLLRRGSKSFTILLDLLRITNPWLAEKMKICYIEEKNRETKLRIQTHSTAAASIEGFGSNSFRHIDDDIRQRVVSYIDVHIAHIAVRDQKHIEKWMSEELQRERRRHNSRARGLVVKEDVVGIPVQIITNSKDTQTDTTMNDLQELYEELAVSLQGTEFDQDMDVSFTLLKEQVSELIDRNNKMDHLFMQCLDRFEDYNDRFRLPLPDLIDHLVVRERDAQLALTEENRLRQKLVTERDFLEKQLNSLEEDFDGLMEKHRHFMVKSQKMPLRRRQDMKYLQVNEKNQTLPNNNLDISSGGADESSSNMRGRSASRFRTTQSRTTTKPRIWSHVAQSNFKAHKSSFDSVKIDSGSAKQRKPNKIYTLKQTV